MASGHKSGTSIGRLKCSLGIVGCFFFFFSSCHVYYKRAGRSKIIAMSPTMAQPMLPVVAAYGGFFHCHGPSSQLACLLRATQEQLSLPTFTWWLIQEGEKVSKILFTFFFMCAHGNLSSPSTLTDKFEISSGSFKVDFIQTFSLLFEL